MQNNGAATLENRSAIPQKLNTDYCESVLVTLSHVQLFVTPRTVVPSTGDLPDPGMEHGSLTLQADSLPGKIQQFYS